MKKYNITYCKRFTAKNGKDYVSLELQSRDISVTAEGVKLGTKTYQVLPSAAKVPAEYCYGGIAECCISFDKKTGNPFAYNFQLPKEETEFSDSSAS